MPKDFFYLIGAETLAKGLVTSFYETGTPLSPQMVQSDNSPSRHHFLRPNPYPTTGRPFIYADARTFAHAKVSQGIRGIKPDGGVLVLTIQPAGTPVNIPFAADGAAVQVLLRAAWAASNYNNCIVTGDAGGPWEIHSVTLNPIGTSITGDTDQLSPEGSTVEIKRVQVGSADQDARFLITQTRKYPCFRSIWTNSLDAALDIGVTIAGSATVNKVYRANWTQGCYEGSSWFTVTANAVVRAIGPVPYNATADEFMQQLILHPEIEADVAGGEDQYENIFVQKTADGRYSITFRGNLGLSDAHTIAEAAKTLEAPKYLEGNLPVDAALTEQLLDGADSIEATFEVEIAETDVNDPVTIVQLTDATFIRGLIANSPSTESDQDEWLSADNSFRILTGVVDYTGGGATKLDGFQTTAGRPVPRYYMLPHPVDGLRPFVLRAGVDAAVPGTIIRPVDFNAVTNQRVYAAL